jgi:hypothetical protein
MSPVIVVEQFRIFSAVFYDRFPEFGIKLLKIERCLRTVVITIGCTVEFIYLFTCGAFDDVGDYIVPDGRMISG